MFVAGPYVACHRAEASGCCSARALDDLAGGGLSGLVGTRVVG
jgi:hypothetical protein